MSYFFIVPPSRMLQLWVSMLGIAPMFHMNTNTSQIIRILGQNYDLSEDLSEVGYNYILA